MPMASRHQSSTTPKDPSYDSTLRMKTPGRTRARDMDGHIAFAATMNPAEANNTPPNCTNSLETRNSTDTFSRGSQKRPSLAGDLLTSLPCSACLKNVGGTKTVEVVVDKESKYTRNMKTPFERPLYDLPKKDKKMLMDQARRLVRETMIQYKQLGPSLSSGAKVDNWRFVADHKPFRLYRQKNCHGLPTFVGIGSLPDASLDDIMLGSLTPDQSSCLELDVLRHSNKLQISQFVLQSLKQPSEAKPFRSFQLKWLAHNMPLEDKGTDFVVLESTGVLHMGTKSNSPASTPTRIGYHVLHSVKLPSCPELTNVGYRRADLSMCILFRPRNKQSGIDVFFRTFVNPRVRGDKHKRMDAQASNVANILRSWQPLRFARSRKTLWLLAQQRGAAQPKDLKIPSTEKCRVCDENFGAVAHYCVFCELPTCFQCRVIVSMSRSEGNPKEGIVRAFSRQVCVECKQRVKDLSAEAIAVAMCISRGKRERLPRIQRIAEEVVDDAEDKLPDMVSKKAEDGVKLHSHYGERHSSAHSRKMRTESGKRVHSTTKDKKNRREERPSDTFHASGRHGHSGEEQNQSMLEVDKIPPLFNSSIVSRHDGTVFRKSTTSSMVGELSSAQSSEEGEQPMVAESRYSLSKVEDIIDKEREQVPGDEIEVEEPKKAVKVNESKNGIQVEELEEESEVSEPKSEILVKEPEEKAQLNVPRGEIEVKRSEEENEVIEPNKEIFRPKEEIDLSKTKEEFEAQAQEIVFQAPVGVEEAREMERDRERLSDVERGSYESDHSTLHFEEVNGMMMSVDDNSFLQSTIIGSGSQEEKSESHESENDSQSESHTAPSRQTTGRIEKRVWGPDGGRKRSGSRQTYAAKNGLKAPVPRWVKLMNEHSDKPIDISTLATAAASRSSSSGSSKSRLSTSGSRSSNEHSGPKAKLARLAPISPDTNDEMENVVTAEVVDGNLLSLDVGVEVYEGIEWDADVLSPVVGVVRDSTQMPSPPPKLELAQLDGIPEQDMSNSISGDDMARALLM